MKLWQLDSILRDERELSKAIAVSQSDWHQFGDWFAQMDQLVRAQDRSKLDRDLPVEFVRKVLSLSQRTYYLSQGQILRATQLLQNDVALTALQAFDRFGGTALEDALEYGSCQI